MAQVEVESEVAGTVWQVVASEGDDLAAGDAIVVLESMKMEVPVEAPEPGQLLELRVGVDDAVEEGQVIAVLSN